MGQELPDNTENPREALDRILAALTSGNAESQRSAILELNSRPYSSPAIIVELEKLALIGGEEVRGLALSALQSPASRGVYKQNAPLNQRDRAVILGELLAWRKNGLLDETRAAILAQRYGFDLEANQPAKHVQNPPQAFAVPQPSAALRPSPPAPRPTLTETLLSESTIKIALYLGAFLVIVAAAILVALDVFRVPILAAATLGFFIGAIATRKRLPQPSFVLAIVFSCLLPFDATVVADTIGLAPQINELYWGGVYFLLSVVCVFGTWFYASRFFSMAAFVALDLSVFNVLTFPGLDYEIVLLGLAVAGLVGLLGVTLLKRWKDTKFASPLFGLTLLHSFILVCTVGLVCLVRAATQTDDAGRLYWLAISLTWVVFSIFALAANSLYPFPLFPWAVTFLLLPLPWTFLQTFNPSPLVFVSALWAFGAMYALGSEAARRLPFDWIQKYHWPLLIQSFLPIFIAWIWGAFENVTYGFGIALGTAVIYFLLTVSKPRSLPWTSSLVTALTAYFSFFLLPFMERFQVQTPHLIAIAALLFLLPDQFLKADLKHSPSLRWPPRLIGILLFAVTLLIMVSNGFDTPGQRALVLVVFALLALGYSIRYRLSWVTYLFSGLVAAVTLETLSQFKVTDLWLPVLSALAALLYLSGSFQHRLAHDLRFSGLSTVGLSTLAAIFMLNDNLPAGWYALLAALLFSIEMYRYKNSWMELGVLGYAALAWALCVYQVSALPRVNLSVMDRVGYQLIGVSALLVLLELLIRQTYRLERKLSVVSVAGAVALPALSSIYLLFVGVDSLHVAAIGFGIFLIVFLVNAFMRHAPRLGFAATASAALWVIYLLRTLEWPNWLFPLIVLAILYYAVGYLLRRSADQRPAEHLLAGWDRVSLFSGLGLGTLLSFSAPFEDTGLAAAIPVALAATLWTVEAFHRRNVWLGFPSNGLYLLSYFMLLNALHVDEPQFYSVGASALGLLMHYLLTRTGSRTGTFLTGMVSQLILLSTTYIQMLNTERLGFFFVLFFQGLVVLLYGIVIRSRSLVITPIIFIVVGAITVAYSALQGISTVLVLGCTGLIMLMLGILAVIMRERLVRIGERFSNWNA
jgi:hypothetical protein